jgi:pimeloyl-ACP methyl ester carboxylesterase
MLNYRIIPHSRSSEWILLLHGLGGSWKTWYKQLPELNAEYNLLLPDLYGHGRTREVLPQYTFPDLAVALVQVLDHLRLQRVHVMGISLGSVVACALGLEHGHRLKSMILGGAVQNMDFKTELLLSSAKYLKHCVPYMWLYRFFAWIIMPGPAQLKSRKVFSREAVNLGGSEFKKWHSLLLQFPELCRDFRNTELCRIPKLFISGEQDYLFLPHVRDHVARDPNSELHVIPGCGHVCNIQAPREFNRIALQHLSIATAYSPQDVLSRQDALQRSAA